MLISSSPKILTLAVLSVLIAACGSDGGSDNSSTSNNGSQSVIDTNTQNVDGEEIAVVTEKKGDNVTEALTPETSEVAVDKDAAVDLNANADDEVTPHTPPANPSTATSEEAVLARLNQRRALCGFGELSVSQKLTDAADNHANYLMYMSQNSDELFQGHLEVQKDAYSGTNNPYFTGERYEERVNTNNQTQIGLRAKPVNYEFRALGEDLSYLTYNDDYAKVYSDNDIALSSINGLLSAPYHLASLVSPNFNQVGISYVSGDVKKPIQLSNGKTVAAQGSVLELMLARPLSQELPEVNEVLSYPCNGITDTAFELRNESPNPFKGTSRNLNDNPIGQPIYILGNGESIVVANYRLLDAAGKPIALKKLTNQTDPNHRLSANEVVLMPLTALKPSQRYQVYYDVSVDGSSLKSKNFSFTTRAR